MMDEEALRYKDFMRCTRLCLFVNIVLVMIKLGWGFQFSSKALFADGVHSLLDVTTDVFVLYAIRIAHLPKDVKHPYGYLRYETLANIIVALALLAAAFGIIYDGVVSLQAPLAMIHTEVAYIALLSIVLNEVTYRYTHIYAVKHQSDLLQSMAVHQRADAATSGVVLLASFSSLYGFVWSDSAGAVAIALLILYYAVPSLLKSIRELLDCGFEESDLAQISQLIEGVPGVISFHLLRTRYMAKFGYMDVHVVVSDGISVSEGHYIGDEVRAVLLSYPSIKDVTVHIDSEEEDDEDVPVGLPSRDLIENLITEKGGDNAEGLSYRLVIHYITDKVWLDAFVDEERQVDQLKQALELLPDWMQKYTIYVKTCSFER